MAKSSLAHLAHPHDSFFNNLESLHSKLGQSSAFVSILMDWVSNCEACHFELDDKLRMMEVFSLLGDLLADAKALLPEA